MTRSTKTRAAIIAIGIVFLLLPAGRAVAENDKREAPDSLKGRTCLEAGCHDDYLKDRFAHGPVAIGSCGSCHTVQNEARHKFSLARKQEQLCSACHLSVVRSRVRHAPAEAAECTACHNPHHASNAKLLLQSDPDKLCADCHDDKGGRENTFVHAPVESKLCTACHEVHDSKYDSLLKADERELCLLCHDELAAGKQHKSAHEPAKETCVLCHSGHSSQYAKLLTAPQPELCYNCHDEKNGSGEKTHTAALSSHGCGRCHDPHVSKHPALASKPQVELCLDCHSKAVVHDGRTIAGIRSTIVEPKLKHGPVGEGDCGACHDVHGPQEPALLAREYPDEFYAPFSVEKYELCFKCHDEQLVLASESDTATGFRNGTRNLHAVHVSNVRKGRTCRACHAAHATDLPKMVRKSVQFGQWELPIGFQETGNGGRCESGCHLPKGYDRVAPVSYAAPAMQFP